MTHRWQLSDPELSLWRLLVWSIPLLPGVHGDLLKGMDNAMIGGRSSVNVYVCFVHKCAVQLFKETIIIGATVN